MQSKVPKAPPSKWDDADKWIASPCHSEAAITHSARSNQGLGPGTLSQPGKNHYHYLIRPPLQVFTVLDYRDIRSWWN